MIFSPASLFCPRSPLVWLLLVLCPELWGQNTEVPGTVAKGAWLLESDLVSVVHDREKFDGYSFSKRSVFLGNLLLSTGLTEHIDVQAGFDGWLQDDPGGGQAIRHAHGDGVLRIKWNFYGQDGQTFAAAILPQLRLPISSHGFGARSCEPGVFLPWSQALDGSWSWGGMLGVDSNSSEPDAWNFSWIGTAFLSRSFGEHLGAYCELVSATPLRAPRVPTLQLGLGFTYALSKAWSLEVCLYRALNSQTPDWNPVMRMSFGF